MKQVKKWQQFETLTADIQRKLAPDAKITPKARVRGKDSGAAREIDILVESKVGQFELRVGIDCKDYKNPVDVGEVGAVVELFKDTRMNKGAIVAASGFSGAAKTMAESNGIELYKLVDTGEHAWRSFVTGSVLVHYVALSAFQPNLTIVGTPAKPAVVRFQSSEIHLIQLYHADGTLLGCIQNLIAEAWERGLIPKCGGQHEIASLTREPSFVETDGQLYPVSCAPILTVEEKYFLGDIPIHNVQGLQDQRTGRVLFGSIAVPPLTIAEIRKNMREVVSPDQLPVKPLLTYEALGSIPMIVLQSVST